MTTIKTIFFDFGNVLAFFDHELTTLKLSQREGIDPRKLNRALYGHPRIHQFERGEISVEDYIDAVCAELSLTCDPLEFRHAYSNIFTPNKPVIDLVPELAKQYRLVLASNTNRIHAEWFVPKFNDPLRHFHHMVLSHEVNARKPERDFYSRCQEHAQAEASECVFIDDRVDNIEAAREHGWHTIHLTDFDALRDGLSRLGIYNVTEADASSPVEEVHRESGATSRSADLESDAG